LGGIVWGHFFYERIHTRNRSRFWEKRQVVHRSRLEIPEAAIVARQRSSREAPRLRLLQNLPKEGTI
jgi:hypothetical protein